MGKPSGGGGGKTNFDQSLVGPPPGNVTTGSEQWIDVGAIPVGQRWWLGIGQFASPDKSIIFEVRTNNQGASAGNISSTAIIYKASVSPRNGMVSADMYKNGRLHTVSVYGTGVEKMWLRLVSKSGTQGSYLYTLTWTYE